MSACADCITGSLDEGTPKGEDGTIAGVPCYITKPAAANGCAVILATDVFGYKLINARLIADVYADAGYICVVPDYFEGEPVNMQLLEAYEALPTQNFFGKIASGLQLALQLVNLVSTAAPPCCAQCQRCV
jgi:dienelactone hydrolase